MFQLVVVAVLAYVVLAVAFALFMRIYFWFVLLGEKPITSPSYYSDSPEHLTEKQRLRLEELDRLA